jgi:hypothetical protein
MALTTTVVNWKLVRVVANIQIVYCLTLRVALVFELVFLVATIALGVMRLGLARTTTVLALLDGTTLGVDVVKFAIYMARVSPCVPHVIDAASVLWHTSVSAAAHSMALDAGRASPLFSIDDRHTGAFTAEDGRRRWLEAVERVGSVERTGKEQVEYR